MAEPALEINSGARAIPPQITPKADDLSLKGLPLPAVPQQPQLTQPPEPLLKVLGTTLLVKGAAPSAELPDGLFSPALDSESYKFAKVDELLLALGEPILPFGRLALLRRLSRPVATVEEILERRATIKTLIDRPELREHLEKILKTLATEKPSALSGFEEGLNVFSVEGIERRKKRPFWTILRQDLRDFFKVSPHIGLGRRNIDSAMREVANLPDCGSRGLADLIGRTRKLRKSADYGFLRGSIMYTRRGFVVGKESDSALGLPINFGGFDWIRLGAWIAPSLLASAFTHGHYAVVGALLLSEGVRFMRGRSEEAFIRQCADSKASEALDILGELEALTMLARAASRMEKMGWKYPDFIETPQYAFSANSLKNPTLALQGAQGLVSNDLSLKGGRPLVLTGANSGGKTTLALSLFQSHFLAQNGLPIPAESAQLSVVDRFIYQGPVFAGLDSEGRLGKELLATKKTMLSGTRHSLTILDEVVGGTSAKEQLDLSESAMDGFRELGGGVTLITHDHELARRLDRKGGVDAQMLPILGDKPSFHLAPGVTESSYAMRVAEKVGFTPNDIRLIVKAKLFPSSDQATDVHSNKALHRYGP